MKLVLKIFIAILFAAFAYILSSIVLGVLMGGGLVPKIIAAVIGVAALLLGIFGKPGSGRHDHFDNTGGPSGPFTHG